jgi:hypothetical protein
MKTGLLVRRVAAALAVATLAVPTVSAQNASGADPFVGTWKLNVAKSSFEPGPPPKEATVVIKKVGDKTSSTLNMELSTGQKIVFEYTVSQDGTEAAIPGGGRVDAVSEYRINVRTVARNDKKDGKVVRSQYSVVSKDGKTMTSEIAAINVQGVPVNDVQLYEKQ